MTAQPTIPPISSLPLILLIHGAWHVQAHYTPLVSALTRAGFPVLAPLMPTSNTPTPAATTLDDDVVFIRSLTKKAIGAGHKVVALMHSYGGVVGSYALTGLDGVVGLVYMTSFIPFEGESLAGIFGGRCRRF